MIVSSFSPIVWRRRGRGSFLVAESGPSTIVPVVHERASGGQGSEICTHRIAVQGSNVVSHKKCTTNSGQFLPIDTPVKVQMEEFLQRLGIKLILALRCDPHVTAVKLPQGQLVIDCTWSLLTCTFNYESASYHLNSWLTDGPN